MGVGGVDDWLGVARGVPEPYEKTLFGRGVCAVARGLGASGGVMARSTGSAGLDKGWAARWAGGALPAGLIMGRAGCC